MSEKVRCSWASSSEMMQRYHDDEWGVPLHDDRKLFEFLTLETFQAGLSWAIVLKKRDGFRQAFADFDPNLVAVFTEDTIEQLVNDANIIRNRLKINAAVTNAKAFLAVQKEFGSFDAYIWNFVDNSPLRNAWQSENQVPATTDLSDMISKDLKSRGFAFVGSTVVYAHMQATGMVNDHIISCHSYMENGV